MRNGILGALTTCLVGAGAALGQSGPEGVAPAGPLAERRSPYYPQAAVGNTAHEYAEATGDRPAVALDGGYDEVERIWVRAEYLLWWIKEGRLAAPLVTTGPATPQGGVLGQRDTRTLFGGSRLKDDSYSGARILGGIWVSPDKSLGVEGTFFGLERHANDFAVNSDAGGNPVLVRPYLDAGQNAEAGSAVAFPNGFRGGVAVNNHTRLWGYDVNGVYNVFRTEGASWDLLLGFRYMDLLEGLTISDTRTLLPGGAQVVAATFNGGLVPEGSTTTRVDRFGTRSQFFGALIGTRVEVHEGPWSVAFAGKVGLGGTRQEVSVRGNSTLSSGVGTTTAPGGLLAVPSNIGRIQHTHSNAIPEFEASVGYWVTQRVRLSVGYNFLYWGEVVRPGDQVARSVNAAQVPTLPQFVAGPANPAIPAQPFEKSNIWVQGINFGLEFRY